MTDEKKKEVQATTIQKASEKYGDMSGLRALIQAIPYVGGSFDTLLVDSGQKFKEQRIEGLITEINERLSKIEKPLDPKAIQNSQEMYDMLIFAFEQSSRTRSEMKRNNFAKIITNQIIDPIDWDKADTILRLLARLNEIHIGILKEALETPICDEPFEGLKVICLNEPASVTPKGVPPGDLSKKITGINESILRFHCAELISMGLLKDEGVGRFGTGPLTYFVATEMAVLLFEQITT